MVGNLDLEDCSTRNCLGHRQASHSKLTTMQTERMKEQKHGVVHLRQSGAWINGVCIPRGGGELGSSGTGVGGME